MFLNLSTVKKDYFGMMLAVIGLAIGGLGYLIHNLHTQIGFIVMIFGWSILMYGIAVHLKVVINKFKTFFEDKQDRT
jgi:hypothetical protein